MNNYIFFMSLKNFLNENKMDFFWGEKTFVLLLIFLFKHYKNIFYGKENQIIKTGNQKEHLIFTSGIK
jgi:hypothetical protein